MINAKVCIGYKIGKNNYDRAKKQQIPTGWKETTLEELANINPNEFLPKGILSKYIAMENLEPFSKKIWLRNMDS